MSDFDVDPLVPVRERILDIRLLLRELPCCGEPGRADRERARDGRDPDLLPALLPRPPVFFAAVGGWVFNAVLEVADGFATAFGFGVMADARRGPGVRTLVEPAETEGVVLPVSGPGLTLFLEGRLAVVGRDVTGGEGVPLAIGFGDAAPGRPARRGAGPGKDVECFPRGRRAGVPIFGLITPVVGGDGVLVAGPGDVDVDGRRFAVGRWERLRTGVVTGATGRLGFLASTRGADDLVEVLLGTGGGEIRVGRGDGAATRRWRGVDAAEERFVVLGCLGSGKDRVREVVEGRGVVLGLVAAVPLGRRAGVLVVGARLGVEARGTATLRFDEEERLAVGWGATREDLFRRGELPREDGVGPREGVFVEDVARLLVGRERRVGRDVAERVVEPRVVVEREEVLVLEEVGLLGEVLRVADDRAGERLDERDEGRLADERVELEELLARAGASFASAMSVDHDIRTATIDVCTTAAILESLLLGKDMLGTPFESGTLCFCG